MTNRLTNIRKKVIIPNNCRERYLPLNGYHAAPLTSLGIYYSGVSDLKPGYFNCCPGLNNQYVIILTESGSGELLTCTNNFQLKTNTIIAIPPEMAWQISLTASNWTILWFYLHADKCRNIIPHNTIFFDQCLTVPRLRYSMDCFYSACSIIADNKKTDTLTAKEATLHAELLTVHLAQSFQKPASNQRPHIELEKLWRRIQKDLSKSWNIGDMCKIANMSPSTLQRLSRKFYNKTPWQIVISYRMTEARTLLSSTDYPLKLIANRLGYGDEFIFSTAFKQYHQQSPKSYRQQYWHY